MHSRALARRRIYARPNPISTGTVAALFGGAALLTIGAYYAFRPSTTAGTGAAPVAGTTTPPATTPATPLTPAQQAIVTALAAGTATLAQVQSAGLTPAQVQAMPTAAIANYGQLLANSALSSALPNTPSAFNLTPTAPSTTG